MKKAFVGVGINSYADLDELLGAEEDAYSLGSWFEHRLQFQTKVLRGEAAVNAHQVLNDVVNGLVENDLLVFILQVTPRLSKVERVTKRTNCCYSTACRSGFSSWATTMWAR